MSYSLITMHCVVGCSMDSFRLVGEEIFECRLYAESIP